MKSTNIFTKKLNFGFTLIELMTALLIFTILALVGLPAYQEYKIRSHMAEAESVVGTMERHSVSYLLAHGSFYSAAPNPASVPGIDAPGAHAEFNGGNDWQALGLPISEGSSVVFSFQAFAGQSAGNGTPVINDYLHSPTENMNLERGRATTSTQKFFPHSAGLASLRDEALRFDFSDFHFFSFAADEEASANRVGSGNCQEICVKMGSSREDCNAKCITGDNGAEDLKTKCYNQCGGEGECFNQCYFGKSDSDAPIKNSKQVEQQKACEEACRGDQRCMSEKCGSGGNNDDDDFSRNIQCNRQCRGDSRCVDQCLGGDSKCGEGRDHAEERCRQSCGGDRRREENCINGNDDGDNDDIAHQCCRARCGRDESCLQGCEGNSCESACRGNQECIANCRHGSCEASCHGDHTCIQRCGQQHCQHTCGGNREREAQCNNDNENGHETCVSRCVDRGGRAETCRRQCDTGGGGSDTDPHDQCVQACGRDERCIARCDDDGSNPPGGNDGGGENPPGGDPQSCPSGQVWNGSSCVITTGGGSNNPPPTHFCSNGGVWNGETCVLPPDHDGGGSIDGECASFGVSTPKDFGVPEGVPGVDFVVFSAVGNFKPGNQCTLVVKVIQARDKKPMRSPASITMNRYE